jgi:dipeptidyl aminopeptidase/acylaminoacyl peptidase
MPAAGGSQPLSLEATAYRPDGPGPFPLAVINHGSPRSDAERRGAGRLRFLTQSRWFVAHGFAVVVPMRRGYAHSDGDWAEGFGPCDDADYLHAGLESARDIGTAARFMAMQPYVDPGQEHQK